MPGQCVWSNSLLKSPRPMVPAPGHSPSSAPPAAPARPGSSRPAASETAFHSGETAQRAGQRPCRNRPPRQPTAHGGRCPGVGGGSPAARPSSPLPAHPRGALCWAPQRWEVDRSCPPPQGNFRSVAGQTKTFNPSTSHQGPEAPAVRPSRQNGPTAAVPPPAAGRACISVCPEPSFSDDQGRGPGRKEGQSLLVCSCNSFLSSDFLQGIPTQNTRIKTGIEANLNFWKEIPTLTEEDARQ